MRCISISLLQTQKQKIGLNILAIDGAANFYEPKLVNSYFGLRYLPTYFKPFEIMFNINNIFGIMGQIKEPRL